jgi:hypothetical protein
MTISSGAFDALVNRRCTPGGISIAMFGRSSLGW